MFCFRLSFAWVETSDRLGEFYGERLEGETGFWILPVMMKRKERAVEELYNVTQIILEPEACKFITLFLINWSFVFSYWCSASVLLSSSLDPYLKSVLISMNQWTGFYVSFMKFIHLSPHNLFT